MGARGPVGKRENELARPRSRRGSDEQEVTSGTMRPVIWPEPDPEWHPIALMLWEGALNSGQADFYQQSDVAYLYNVCEELSTYKLTSSWIDKETGETRTKRSGQMFQSIMSAMQALLLTEGDRRRVRIELQKPVEAKPDLKVVGMEQYRNITDG